MNIHLIRSKEFSNDTYLGLFGILEKSPGSLKFISDNSESEFDDDEIEEHLFSKSKLDIPQFSKIYKESVAESFNLENWPPPFPDNMQVVTWNSIFEKCNDYRKKNKIRRTDGVVLLTNYSNDQNWFSGIDPSGDLNYFVHTDQWELYIPSDPIFPIAYELLASILQGKMFDNYSELNQHVHEIPRGCINDFCREKKDVSIKLRTADICHDCQKILKAKKIDQRLTDQVMRTFETIRTQMLFRERFKTSQQPSRICLKGPSKKIFFTDLDNAELKLTPLEKTLYLLFLKHKNGIKLKDLYLYQKEIAELYREVGNAKTTAEFNNSIHQLTNPTENSVNEKLSKIARKISILVGSELSPNYTIDGPRSDKKRILLDRSLVSVDENWRENN